MDILPSTCGKDHVGCFGGHRSLPTLSSQAGSDPLVSCFASLGTMVSRLAHAGLDVETHVWVVSGFPGHLALLDLTRCSNL